MHTKFEGMDTKPHGKPTKLQGMNTKLLGKLRKLQGMNTKLLSKLTKLQGMNTKPLGELTKLRGMNTKRPRKLTKLCSGLTKGHFGRFPPSAFAFQFAPAFSSGFSKNVLRASRMAAHTTQESATLKEGQGLKGGKPKSKRRKSTT